MIVPNKVSKFYTHSIFSDNKFPKLKLPTNTMFIIEKFSNYRINFTNKFLNDYLKNIKAKSITIGIVPQSDNAKLFNFVIHKDNQILMITENKFRKFKDIVFKQTLNNKSINNFIDYGNIMSNHINATLYNI